MSHIWVPKFKIVEAKDALVRSAAQLSGRFILEAVKADGRRRKLAEFDNLILDQGLDFIGTSSGWLSWCSVGSGTNAPANSNSGMQALVAQTSTLSVSAANLSQLSTLPYYWQNSRTFRFGMGAAAGNLAEVGVGWSNGNTSLFSRARILDGSQNPTTITVLSDEFLDVTYIVRSYPATADIVSTLTIGATTYDYTSRPSEIDISNYWAPPFRGGMPQNNSFSQFLDAYGVGSALGTVFTSPTSPNGVNGAGTGSYVGAYANGTYYQDSQGVFGLTEGNFAGGIGVVRCAYAGGGMRQILFTPAIPKTASQTLALTFRNSWARRP